MHRRGATVTRASPTRSVSYTSPGCWRCQSPAPGPGPAKQTLPQPAGSDVKVLLAVDGEVWGGAGTDVVVWC